MAHLVCPSRHTVTSLITTNGNQFKDWSADYGLYARKRVFPSVLFNHIRQEVEQLKPVERPLCVALDDTILRKTGKHIPGTAWRKDPLGPPFNINLIWAQRMLQISAAVTNNANDVRMIPIAFEDASTPRKPRKTASEEEKTNYKEVMKQRNLNAIAVSTLASIQESRRAKQQSAPELHVVVDGSYTNRKVLRHLPENTTLIGRIRKDAKLSKRPEDQPSRGRKRIYGEDVPTPEQIRQDAAIPWTRVKARAVGKVRTFRVKTLSPLRWRAAGEQDLRLVVIAPVAYHLKKGGKRLYRQPAFLICTDPDMPLEDLIQEYIWRWDIEVNHRDEKTILGVGQAQVRNEYSVASIPASAVASYAMLHIAAIKAYGWAGQPGEIPPAKWRNPKSKHRASTQDLINELRRELWASAIKEQHLSDFMRRAQPDTKSNKCGPNLPSALMALAG